MPDFLRPFSIPPFFFRSPCCFQAKSSMSGKVHLRTSAIYMSECFSDYLPVPEGKKSARSSSYELPQALSCLLSLTGISVFYLVLFFFQRMTAKPPASAAAARIPQRIILLSSPVLGGLGGVVSFTVWASSLSLAWLVTSSSLL